MADAKNTTMAQALRLYRAGNDAGLGYAPYADEACDDSIDEAVACAEADGWTVVLHRETSEAVLVSDGPGGGTMAIGGDAFGMGAWAVIISEVRS